MTFEEKVAMANTVRSRDRFGPVSPEELAEIGRASCRERV